MLLHFRNTRGHTRFLVGLVFVSRQCSVKWQRIWSLSSNRIPVLSSLITYYQICSNNVCARNCLLFRSTRVHPRVFSTCLSGARVVHVLKLHFVFMFSVQCWDVRYNFRIKTMLESSKHLYCKWVDILSMLFVFIYIYLCPTRFLSQMRFVSFNSNKTGVMCGAGTATLPEHMSSPPPFSGVRVAQSSVFLCNVLEIIVCPFVLFLFAIVLSVLIWFTVSGYLFGIFQISFFLSLFFCSLYCLP